MRGKVYINEQEESQNNYQFGGNINKVMTKGFKHIFSDEVFAVAFIAVALILEKYPNNADYLQTFEYHIDGRGIEFWCISDNKILTFLLPDEY